MSTEDVAKSIWKPLNTGQTQIRLLSILPSRYFEQSLRCLLHTVSLLDYADNNFNDDGGGETTKVEIDRLNIDTAGDARKSYEAISYACGDINDTTLIAINGIQYSTLTSLVTALKHFRSKTSAITVWCDQLCINQYDFAERAEQIVLMRHIHSRADAVRIWSGRPKVEQNSTVVFRVADESTDYRDCADSWDDFRRTIECIEEFAQQSWFRRLWIIQEAALARRAYLHYGTNHIRWTSSSARHLSHRFTLLYDHLAKVDVGTIQLGKKLEPEEIDRFVGLNSLLEKIDDLHEQAYRVASNVGSWEQSYWTDTFHKLVLSCRAAASTDLRDKVFGLLGLAPTATARSIIKSYNSPIENVYIDWTVFAIRQTNSLSVLEHARLPETFVSSADTMFATTKGPHLYLPSWVPDLSRPPSPLADLTNQMSTLFHASGRLNAQVWYSPELRTLRVPALGLDTITKTIHVADFSSRQDQLLMLLRDIRVAMRSDFRSAPSSQSGYITGTSLEFAVWDTLNLGMAVAEQRENTPDSNNDNDELHQQQPSDRTNPNGDQQFFQPTDLPAFRTWHTLPPTTSPEKDTAADKIYLSNILHHTTQLEHFTIFTTQTGFLGVAFDREIRRGDAVFILSGGRLPFVLRPVWWSADDSSFTSPSRQRGTVDGHDKSTASTNTTRALFEDESVRYRLVSPAYVSGVMRGEATDIESPLFAANQEDDESVFGRVVMRDIHLV